MSGYERSTGDHTRSAAACTMLIGVRVMRQSIGASGAVMGMANLVPRLCVELVRAAHAGETARATECQALVNELVLASRAGPFPSTDKFLAAELWGADVGYRAPYDPLAPDEVAAVRARLEPLRPKLAPFLRR